MPVNQLLKGKIVTMTAEDNVLDGGYIYIVDQLIQGVYAAGQLPENLKTMTITDTQGVIYPGLMDLHNHFVYNVLPLWVVPKKYSDREQWPSSSDYQSGVSQPIKQVLSQYSESSKAIVRFVEAKALMGGTTTGQGIGTQINGGNKVFDGAMRNVEQPNAAALPPASDDVLDLVVGGPSGPAKIDAFRKALNRTGQKAYFYHLAEGIDSKARQFFLDLQANDLINDHLVGIHSLGLKPEDMDYMASKGAKVVWSPFSNQLLYGQTLDLNVLKKSKYWAGMLH
jgi:5-methylthioadenosine/S-adenosylhomocysteine deaminase